MIWPLQLNVQEELGVFGKGYPASATSSYYDRLPAEAAKRVRGAVGLSGHGLMTY